MSREKEKLVTVDDFPKKSRLLSANDYSPVFKQAKYRVSNQYFLLLATPSRSDRARLGLVIAKKNVPKAVQRNRIKRIIRETFRTQKPDFGTIDIIVMARKGLSELDNREIKQRLQGLFAELIKKTRSKRD